MTRQTTTESFWEVTLYFINDNIGYRDIYVQKLASFQERLSVRRL